MNLPYLVLVYVPTDEEFESGVLGEPEREEDFNTEKEAREFYDSVQCRVKILMKYNSPEPDADGTVLEELWTEKLPEREFEVTRWTPVADCTVILDPADYEGKTLTEIEKVVQGHSLNNDNWQPIESEEFDKYEVSEN